MEKTSALPTPHAVSSQARSKPATTPAGGDTPVTSFSGLLAAMDEDPVELPEPSRELAISEPPGDNSGTTDPLMPMPPGAGIDAASSMPVSAPSLESGLDAGSGAAGIRIAVDSSTAGLASPAAGLEQSAVAALLPVSGASALRPAVGPSPVVNPVLGNLAAGRLASTDLADSAVSGRLAASGDNAFKVAANAPSPESLGNLLAQMKVSGGNSPAVAAAGLSSDIATSTVDIAAFGAKSLRASALVADASKASVALNVALAAGVEKRATQSTDVLQAANGAAVDVAAATLVNGVDGVAAGGRFAREFRDEVPSKSTEKMAVGEASLSFTSRFDAATFNLDSAAITATAAQEDVLSQQLQYWVNQKSQSAELTLDAGTTNPVEVSITLTGNEAQVVFRSDQMQTRQMLDANLSDLRELLSAEGLVLAGVSVSDTGGNGKSSGQAGGQEHRKNVPQAIAASLAAPAAVQTRLAVDGTRGRSLDVFA